MVLPLTTHHPTPRHCPETASLLLLHGVCLFFNFCGKDGFTRAGTLSSLPSWPPVGTHYSQGGEKARAYPFEIRPVADGPPVESPKPPAARRRRLCLSAPPVRAAGSAGARSGGPGLRRPAPNLPGIEPLG